MYVDEGTYYCVGGFQRLVDAFVDGLTMHRGELVLGRRVEEIRIQDGRIQSVILDNGQVVDAGLILSNMDPRMTMENLNDGGQIWKSYGKKLKDLDLSVSVACMYLATDLDVTALGVPAETIRYGSWDPDQNFDVSTTDRVDSILITIPSLRDASLAPEGEQVVIVKMLVPSDLDEADDSKKRQYAEALLDTAEIVLPGLRHHITYMDGPENGNPHIEIIKTIYGWSAKPKQVGIRRLKMKTPIEGLYLVGQWTQPGHGVWSVVASGLKVARLVLDKDTSRGYLPLGL